MVFVVPWWLVVYRCCCCVSACLLILSCRIDCNCTRCFCVWCWSAYNDCCCQCTSNVVHFDRFYTWQETFLVFDHSTRQQLAITNKLLLLKYLSPLRQIPHPNISLHVVLDEVTNACDIFPNAIVTVIWHY